MALHCEFQYEAIVDQLFSDNVVHHKGQEVAAAAKLREASQQHCEQHCELGVHVLPNSWHSYIRESGI